MQYNGLFAFRCTLWSLPHADSVCVRQIIAETIPALVKLKETGKVRFIGITGLPLKVFHYVLDRVPPGTIDVVLSYCHYSMNDDSLAESLPYLKSKGVGVISASPLSMGLLTDQGPPDWHPAPEKLKVSSNPTSTSRIPTFQRLSSCAMWRHVDHNLASVRWKVCLLTLCQRLQTSFQVFGFLMRCQSWSIIAAMLLASNFVSRRTILPPSRFSVRVCLFFWSQISVPFS